MKSKTLTALSCAAALAGAVSIAATMTPTEAVAGVKCYGISKAGENDCANKAGTHSCAGQSKASSDGGEWKAMKTAEACTTAHGQTKPFDGVNPDKKA
jgi:uncharacterized membrane protein